MKKIKIGNIEVNNTFLAPMAGITDLPFRLLCHEMGAGVVCMEMVSAKAILYNNKNTEEMLEIREDERPVSLQLFGSDPKIMSEIAKRIENRPFDILDINMGCPMPKIVNNGEGSALMKSPKLVYDIVSSISKAISKPVTVKIRAGFDKEHINAVEIAKVAEEAGAKAVAVHGRTKEQLYEGTANWNVIADVKRAITIPVIGNGDVVDGPSAVRMIKETNVDGIMIGRAARGNPWIFRDVNSYLDKYDKKLLSECDENKKVSSEHIITKNAGDEKVSASIDISQNESDICNLPTINEKVEMMKRHYALLTEAKGEFIATREMRKHVGWYTAGMPNSAAMRRKVNTIEDSKSMYDFIDEIANI